MTMKGQMPAAEARPLSETIAVSDIDQMLHDYVRPSFLKMNDAQRKQAIESMIKIASGE